MFCPFAEDEYRDMEKLPKLRGTHAALWRDVFKLDVGEERWIDLIDRDDAQTAYRHHLTSCFADSGF